ncbi:MAG: hydrogenase maturation nickel metallochaperone HypA [Bacteroidetes bacterium]|nr:MAG: hydrogenase maturation nickel metallochaperone HypA [Bacteroidota bacterium]
MHEISLVRNIFRTLQDEFPDRIDKVRRVQLKAGLLSNVQPILMQNAWEAVLADEPLYAGIELEVKVLPILIHCEPCNLTNEVENYRFVCACGKPSRHVVQGDELLISEVEFED